MMQRPLTSAVCAGAVLALLYATPSLAADATLFIQPATGVYPIGEPFTVDIRIDTGGEAIGTADATVAFDPADIAYVSMSQDGSIFSTVLIDTSRTPGRIDLSGFVARGGQAYTGNDGLMARLTFMPQRNVATQLRFAHAAATPLLTPLAASVGELTNVVANLASATYTLVPKQSVPPVATVVYAQEQAKDGIPITPLPVPKDGWLASSSVELTWTVPSGATDMRSGYGSSSLGMPTDDHDAPMNDIKLLHLVEGTTYFFLQFAVGDAWGPITRYPLQVDMTPPVSLSVVEAERKDPSDPRVGFVIEAADTLSGIGSYEISIDGAEAREWQRPDDGIYRPEGLEAGEHTLTVRALDKAGNSVSKDVTFLVKTIEAPILTDIPDKVLTGGPITVRGTTYPDSDVTVYIAYNDGEASQRSVRSDGSGAFTAAVTDAAREGKYTVWFTVTDVRGATSPPSVKRSVTATQPFIMLFGSIAVTYLSVIVPLVALILLLGLVLWLSFTWARGYRKRVRNETNEAYHVVREEFENLRDELVKQIGALERANQSRELTREEMRILRDLSERLEQVERHIANEIEDIETVKEDGSDGLTVGHRTLDAYQTAVQDTPHQGGIVNPPRGATILSRPGRSNRSLRIEQR